MNNATFDSFFATLEEMGRAILKAARSGAAAVSTMSWPAIAVCCVFLAFALTIIPLALFLFVMFMVIKFVVTAFDKRAARGPATPYRSADDKGE
ncbi:hypothetical protein [Massilia sp. CF038]|uniref:hypothetical protein n=1 Tax=Massilia sp. CF038 TaxID=1881045 RepID=UPI000912A966|nr:hypothetical protein [Massilia sp. CF038]SHH23444.1 hypothetical protein SAMN05428948_3439 [Massilia sp. CF038]